MDSQIIDNEEDLPLPVLDQLSQRRSKTPIKNRTPKRRQVLILDTLDSCTLSRSMARPLRVEYAGACYHVINRGNYRQRIFAGKGAAESFEQALGEAVTCFGWRIHAYVIVGNHFHLAVELGEPNLSEGMKWLQGTWIRRFNRFRDWTGRPFQGCYKGILAEPGHVFGQICHYIHLNPVRAGIVDAKKVGEYRWSSLALFVKKDRPPWLEASTVLEESGKLADTGHGWKKYREYLGWLAIRGRKAPIPDTCRQSRSFKAARPDFDRPA